MQSKKFSPDSQLVILLPGAPSISLKNERKIVMNKGRPFLVPSGRVTKFMSNTRAAIHRQLPGDWVLLETGIAVVLEMRRYYNTAFPRNDIDNFYTTVQECLQETIVEDDKQIEYFLAIRKRTTSKMGQHSLLFLWQTFNYSEDELIQFLNWRQTYEYRPTHTGAGLSGGIAEETISASVPAPF